MGYKNIALWLAIGLIMVLVFTLLQYCKAAGGGRVNLSAIF